MYNKNLIEILSPYMEEIIDILDNFNSGESYYNDELMLFVNLSDYILYKFNYRKRKDLLNNEKDIPEDMIDGLYQIRDTICHIFRIIYSENRGEYNRDFKVMKDCILYRGISNEFDDALNKLNIELKKMKEEL